MLFVYLSIYVPFMPTQDFHIFISHFCFCFVCFPTTPTTTCICYYYWLFIPVLPAFSAGSFTVYHGLPLFPFLVSCVLIRSAHHDHRRSHLRSLPYHATLPLRFVLVTHFLTFSNSSCAHTVLTGGRDRFVIPAGRFPPTVRLPLLHTTCACLVRCHITYLCTHLPHCCCYYHDFPCLHSLSSVLLPTAASFHMISFGFGF